MKTKLTVILFLLFHNTYGQLYFPPIASPVWDTVSPASQGWCLDSLQTTFDFLEQKNTKAFIVLKDGKIAIEKYFGSFTKDSVWYWASAGKTLTAFLVGQAQEQGYLKITDTTSKYLGSGWTSLNTAQEQAITVRHQLTMTTGLDDNFGNDNCTQPACLVYKTSAGNRWAYHNAPYTLLHEVIDNATGNFNTFFNTQFRNRTGAFGLWLPGTGADSFNRIYYSTPRNMARFGLLLLNKGVWNTDTLLRDTAYLRQMTTTSQSMNMSYGYLTWLNGKASYMMPGLQLVITGSLAPNAPADMYAGLGKNDQKLYVIPSYNMVIVRMGNDAGFPAAAVSAFDNELWGKLKNIFCTPVGVNNTIIAKENWQVYPNPAKDYVVITNTDKKPYTAILYDVTGRAIKQITTRDETYSLETSEIVSGIYYLHIQSNEAKTVIKILKQ